MHSREINLLDNLILYFNCGYINVNPTKPVVYFSVRKLSEITQFIIPHFKVYPVIGLKSFDFEEFCQIVELIKNKDHLTEKGLKQIQEIQSKMNQRRDNSLTEINLTDESS